MACSRLSLTILLAGSLAGASASGADPFGTLFTTSEERARLDAVRAGSAPAGAAPDQAPRPGAAENAQEIRLNGTLVSSFGNKAAWINGKNRLDGRAEPGPRVQVLGTGQIRLQTGPGAIAHSMKPGQVLNPATGQLRESYQQGTVEQTARE